MKWTKEKPKEPGKYYWYRSLTSMKPRVILLVNLDGKLWSFSNTSRFPIETFEGEWSDKAIEPPTE